jgi:hypothetical protein
MPSASVRDNSETCTFALPWCKRPVAHTEQTLANEYLARNRGNLAEYQKVVASALTEQVAKASTRGRLNTLSRDDIAEARQHPTGVAARYGMDAATLQRMLAAGHRSRRLRRPHQQPARRPRPGLPGPRATGRSANGPNTHAW